MGSEGERVDDLLTREIEAMRRQLAEMKLEDMAVDQAESLAAEIASILAQLKMACERRFSLRP